MTHVHIRLKDTGCFEETIKKLIKYSPDRYAYCTEFKPGNLHMHFNLYVDVTKARLRQILNKLGYKGNRYYSTSEIRDLDKAMAYIVKQGEYTIHGYSDDEIKKWKELDQKIKRDIKLKGWQKVMYSLEEQELPCTEWVVKRAIIDYHVKHGLMVRKFHLKAMYDTIMLNGANDFDGLDLFD